MFYFQKGISQCPSKQTTEYNILLAVDETDDDHLDQFSQYVDEEVNSLMTYLERKGAFSYCHSSKVTILPINSLANNRPIGKVGYPSIDKKFSGKQIKERFYNPFKNRLFTYLKQFAVTDTYKEPKKTKIFEPICRFINEKVKNKPFTIVLFTDAIENNGQLSFESLYSKDASEILTSLEQGCQCVLPSSLSNLQVMIVSFRTIDNDDSVTRAHQIWKDIFQSRGAKIVTSTSLDYELLLR